MRYSYFAFRSEGALATILYLAHTAPLIEELLTQIYLADKESLLKYGRFLYGETYFAHHGLVTPVYARDATRIIGRHAWWERRGGRIIPKRLPCLEHLSASDIECLDAAKRLSGWPCCDIGAWAHYHRHTWAVHRAGKGGIIPISALAMSWAESPQEAAALFNHLDGNWPQ